MLRRTYFFGVCIAIMGVSLFTVSCAPLPKRIDATHLSCKSYPKLVDGDLATNSFLKVKSFVEKDNTAYKHSLRYGDWVEGKHKTEALIQLDAITPVAYIQIHPISNIYRLSVDTSTAEIANEKSHHFEPVRSHKIARSENGEVIRIDIDRPVRVLRVSIYANRDLAQTTREPLTQKTKVTFKDIVIQEIRVYQ